MGIENTTKHGQERHYAGSLPLMGIENPYPTIERDRLWDSVGNNVLSR